MILIHEHIGAVLQRQDTLCLQVLGREGWKGVPPCLPPPISISALHYVAKICNLGTPLLPLV